MSTSLLELHLKSSINRISVNKAISSKDNKNKNKRSILTTNDLNHTIKKNKHNDYLHIARHEIEQKHNKMNDVIKHLSETSDKNSKRISKRKVKAIIKIQKKN